MRTGSTAQWGNMSRIGAIDHILVHAPQHPFSGIGSHLFPVCQCLGQLSRSLDIDTHIPGIAVDHHHHILAHQGFFRSKGTVIISQNDSMAVTEFDSVKIPFALLCVRKRGFAIGFRTAAHAVQNGGEHGSGNGLIRSKSSNTHTLHITVSLGILHRNTVPGRGLYILKAGGLR